MMLRMALPRDLVAEVEQLAAVRGCSPDQLANELIATVLPAVLFEVAFLVLATSTSNERRPEALQPRAALTLDPPRSSSASLYPGRRPTRAGRGASA